MIPLISISLARTNSQSAVKYPAFDISAIFTKSAVVEILYVPTAKAEFASTEENAVIVDVSRTVISCINPVALTSSSLPAFVTVSLLEFVVVTVLY